jgi:hypothetical protein
MAVTLGWGENKRGWQEKEFYIFYRAMILIIAFSKGPERGQYIG